MKTIGQMYSNSFKGRERDLSISLGLDKDGQFEGIENDQDILQFFRLIKVLSLSTTNKMYFWGYIVKNPLIFCNLEKLIIELYGKIENDNPWPSGYMSDLTNTKSISIYSHNLNGKTLENFLPQIRLPRNLEHYHYHDTASLPHLEGLQCEGLEDNQIWEPYNSQFDHMNDLKSFYFNMSCRDEDLNWFGTDFYIYFSRLKNLQSFSCQTNQMKISREKIPKGYYDMRNHSLELIKVFNSLKLSLHSLEKFDFIAPLMRLDPEKDFKSIPILPKNLEKVILGDFWFGLPNLRSLLQFFESIAKGRDSKPLYLHLNQIYILEYSDLSQFFSELYQPRNLFGQIHLDLSALDFKIVLNHLIKFLRDFKGRPIDFSIKMDVTHDGDLFSSITKLTSDKSLLKCLNNLQLNTTRTVWLFSQGKLTVSEDF